MSSYIIQEPNEQDNSQKSGDNEITATDRRYKIRSGVILNPNPNSGNS